MKRDKPIPEPFKFNATFAAHALAAQAMAERREAEEKAARKAAIDGAENVVELGERRDAETSEDLRAAL